MCFESSCYNDNIMVYLFFLSKHISLFVKNVRYFFFRFSVNIRRANGLTELRRRWGGRPRTHYRRIFFWIWKFLVVVVVVVVRGGKLLRPITITFALLANPLPFPVSCRRYIDRTLHDECVRCRSFRSLFRVRLTTPAGAIDSASYTADDGVSLPIAAEWIANDNASRSPAWRCGVT